MQIIATAIPEVLIIEPKVFRDDRGFFYESFNQRQFQTQTGISVEFVQDNHSHSRQSVLRGLHYQIEQAQGKLVRAIAGTIFDVAVDLRRSSPTFGQWVGVELSAENCRQLWVPVGFAHGFVVRSETADVLYKTTQYYSPPHDRCIRWDDPDLKIDWGLTTHPLLSAKDQQGQAFQGADVFN